MSALDLLLVLLLMWGVVAAIYLVLFFPNILNATKRAVDQGHAHKLDGKAPAREHNREHPTFPRAA